MMKNKNKETAWYNESDLPNDMAHCASGSKEGWNLLEYTSHFPQMKKLIDLTGCKKMADLGCGAGEVGRVLKDEFEYVGFDLPHIVEKVSKKINPELNFVHFDAYDDDFSFLSEFDLILCNGFISELVQPLEVLNKILSNSKKYVIIHRQYILDETKLDEYTTYANLKTIRSIIGNQDFNQLLNKNKFEKVVDRNFEWGKTILLKKNNQ